MFSLCLIVVSSGCGFLETSSSPPSIAPVQSVAEVDPHSDDLSHRAVSDQGQILAGEFAYITESQGTTASASQLIDVSRSLGAMLMANGHADGRPPSKLTLDERRLLAEVLAVQIAAHGGPAEFQVHPGSELPEDITVQIVKAGTHESIQIRRGTATLSTGMANLRLMPVADMPPFAPIQY